MGIFSKIERINQLHALIKMGKTGSPKTLAKQLGISRATLYNLLDELKTFDAPVVYSRAHKSFLYTKEFNLELKCTIELIETDELIKINGGGYSFFLPFNFLDGRNILL